MMLSVRRLFFTFSTHVLRREGLNFVYIESSAAVPRIALLRRNITRSASGVGILLSGL